MNDMYIESLTYVGADGERIIRPPGLSDQPGGAATAGALTVVLGAGLSVIASSNIGRTLTLGAAAVGLAAIYLTQVRSLLLMSVGALAMMAVMLFRRGQVAVAGRIALSAGVLVIVAFFWARSVGGQSVEERFIGITQQGAMRSYQENRGGFVSQTFGELLDSYPLGAGLGRWGMMQIYFANPDKVESAPIYVEIQLTGWLLDGGVPMWVLYGGAVLMSLLAAYRLSMRKRQPELASLALIVLCVQVLIAGFGWAGPVFNTQLGILFWFLASSLHGAARGETARDRRPHSMTRTRRFLGGVTLGSLQLALATVVGLWMTPFLLGRLGSETLGLWLIAQQLLGYLMLMDLGVNAVLPRETAYAMGRASGAATGELPQVIARARRAVTFQIPLVVAATCAAGIWVATRGVGTVMPLLLVLARLRGALPSSTLSIRPARSAGVAISRQAADCLVGDADDCHHRPGPGRCGAVGAGHRLGDRADHHGRCLVAPCSRASSRCLAST